METKDILEQALKLSSEEKIILVEELTKSLDIPDKKVDEIWIEEAQKRLNAYRKGELGGITMEKVFNGK